MNPQTAEFNPHNIIFFHHLNTVIKLNPVAADYYVFLSKALRRHRHLVFDVKREPYWQKEMMAAIVRAPSWIVPIRDLAFVCSHKYFDFPKCDQLFKEALLREPQYGYVHVRYADYLYAKAIKTPFYITYIAPQVCRHYGIGISSMRATGFRVGLYEKRAFSNCLNIAESYQIVREIMIPFKKKLPPHQWYLLGTYLGRKNSCFWDNALPLVWSDLEAAGSILQYYVYLARGLGETHRYQRGVEILNRYCSLYPQDALGWEALIRYMGRNVAWFSKKRIIEALQQVSERAAFQLSSFLYFAVKACQLREDKLADFFFGKVFEFDPYDATIYADRAQCLLSRGELKKAIIFYKKAISINPNSAKLRLELGDVYANLNQYIEAMKQFQEGLKLSPNNPAIKKAIKRMGVYE